MVLAAVAAIAGAGLSVLVKRLIDADRGETKSYEQVSRLQDLRASSRSAVSNLRAFILSGSTTYRSAQAADAELAERALQRYVELQESDSDGATLHRDLASFRRISERVMGSRQQLGSGAASSLGEDPELNASINSLEANLASTLAARTTALEKRREDRQEEYLLTELAFAGTMLFGTLALVVAGMGLQRERTQRLLADERHASVRQELSTAQAVLQLNEKKDPVTGILNRLAFDEIFHAEFEKGLKSRAPLSIVVMELDQLAPIHAARGKEIADMLLAQTASILKDSFRGGDICCRFSETEFAVVLPRTNLQNASIAAERARRTIESAEWPNCTVTGSFGVAQADYLREAIEFLTRAEQALDYARRTGHNRVTAIKAYLPMAA